MWIIVALTTTEAVSKVLIVLVVLRWLFGVDTAHCLGLGIDSKCTRGGLWKTSGAAVADEASLVEKLDELMFTVALNRARIAHTGGIIHLRGIVRGSIARYACEE